MTWERRPLAGGRKPRNQRRAGKRKTMKSPLIALKRWFLVLLLATFALSPFLGESQVVSRPGKPTVSGVTRHKHKKHRRRHHRRRHRRRHRHQRRRGRRVAFQAPMMNAAIAPGAA